MSSLLNRLPDDILHVIVENLHTEDEHDTYHIVLSQVCRRLRYFVLNISHLWTTIGFSMTLHNVGLHLARSKKESLKVYLLLPDHRRETVERLDRFLRLVAKESERWASFVFKFARVVHTRLRRETDEFLYNTLLTHFQHRSVPHLEVMYVKLPRSRALLYADQNVPQRLLQFYSKWSIPRLRILVVNNSVPPSRFGGSLEYLELQLDAEIRFNHQMRLADLHKFLSTCSNLQVFKLHLGSLGADSPPEELSTIPLPALRNYRVKITSHSAFSAFIAITSVLRTPALSTWHVAFHFETEYEAGQSFLIERLLNATLNDFFVLRRLNLSVVCKLREAFPLNLIFARFRYLHHLVIEVKGMGFSSAFKLPTGLDHLTPPPLRSLTLSNCRKMSAKYFKDVMTALKAGESWPKFRKLHIKGCSRVSEEDIRAVVPESLLIEGIEGDDFFCYFFTS